jgi:hypothetical protein
MPTRSVGTFQCAWKEPTFGAALSQAMPMLETLALPYGIHQDNYLALPRFSSLRTMEFGSDLEDVVSADQLASTLSQCCALTSLVFRQDVIPLSSDQWSILFTGASNGVTYHRSASVIRSSPGSSCDPCPSNMPLAMAISSRSLAAST